MGKTKEPVDWQDLTLSQLCVFNEKEKNAYVVSGDMIKYSIFATKGSIRTVTMIPKLKNACCKILHIPYY